MPHAFLIEAGFWGLPYGSIARDLRDVPPSVLAVFTRERLQAGRARLWISANRIGILVDGIPEIQPDLMTEIRGPKAAVAYDFNRLPTPAARGFASAQGVELKDLAIRDVDGEKFLFARRGDKGKPAVEIVPRLISAVLAALPWLARPWNTEMIFPQPPAYVCALLDDKIMNCTLDGVVAGRETGLIEGGVFRKISVPSAVEYTGIMSGLGLTPLPLERQKIIESHFQSIVEPGASIRKDRQILDRISFEIERPQPMTLNLNGDAAKDLPEAIYLQILCESPAYLPIESSRGEMLPRVVGFVEKRNLAANETDVRARDVARRMRVASDAWQADLSKPLDEWAAGLRLLAHPSGTGTLYDAAVAVSRKAQQLSRQLGMGTDVQESQVDRVILLTMSEYCFSIVRKYSSLGGMLIPIVAERQGIPPETVAIIRDTAAFWAGRDVFPKDRTAIVCSLAGMFTRLRETVSVQVKESYADRLLALLDANDIYMDILCAGDSAGSKELWLEAIGRKMQREGLDRRKFDWLIPDEGLDPVAILTAARTWKDGLPAESEQLKLLQQRLHQHLKSIGATDLPYQPETPPEKALQARLEKLEMPLCLSYVEIFEHLAACRIDAEACLMDLPATIDTSLPEMQRRVSLLRRYKQQLRRLPFLTASSKPQAGFSAGGAT